MLKTQTPADQRSSGYLSAAEKDTSKHALLERSGYSYGCFTRTQSLRKIKMTEGYLISKHFANQSDHVSFSHGALLLSSQSISDSCEIKILRQSLSKKVVENKYKKKALSEGSFRGNATGACVWV